MVKQHKWTLQQISISFHSEINLHSPEGHAGCQKDGP